MRYINQPPALESLPPYILRRYGINLEYIIALFRWSEQEYNDVKNLSIARRNESLYRKMTSITPLHVLAMSDEFYKLMMLLKDNLLVWGKLPNQFRKALCDAVAVYKKIKLGYY